MKNVLISNSNLLAKVDDEDYARCAHISWSLIKGNYLTGWVPGIGTMLLHRFILWLFKGDARKIDHKDRDRLNCQKQNLRIATAIQNQGNRTKQNNTTSQFRGVYWSKARNKWRAFIGGNHTSQHLGMFDNEYDAARAYDIAALQKWGEFANLNLQ